jgi:hypothetical protein
MRNGIGIFMSLLISMVVSCSKDTTTFEGDPTVNGGIVIAGAEADRLMNLQEMGVLPENSAITNKTNLQQAIFKAKALGRALYLPPAENGYPIKGTITLSSGVSIFGSQEVSGSAEEGNLVGSIFRIEDGTSVFMKLESATRLSGLHFYYPGQTFDNPAQISRFAPTLQLSSEKPAQGVTLTDLTFYGEYTTMDFLCSSSLPCEQILIENCKAYPLSGQFVMISCCYDIPRVLHCSVDPAILSSIGRSLSKEMLDKVATTNNYAYYFDSIDNLVLMDISASCVYGGIYIGASTYGQLTGFTFNSVYSGIFRTGNEGKNRTWLLSQGKINANVGNLPDNLHPITIEGNGYTSFVNVTVATESDSRITSQSLSNESILVEGNGSPNVSLANCVMSGYQSDSPITVTSKSAKVRASSCVDKEGNIFNYYY